MLFFTGNNKQLHVIPILQIRDYHTGKLITVWVLLDSAGALASWSKFPAPGARPPSPVKAQTLPSSLTVDSPQESALSGQFLFNLSLLSTHTTSSEFLKVVVLFGPLRRGFQSQLLFPSDQLRVRRLRSTDSYSSQSSEKMNQVCRARAHQPRIDI